MKCESFGFSDIGKIRSHNEDTYLCNKTEGLFLVADGMGGHAAGATASRLAVTSIDDFVTRSRSQSNFWPVKQRKNMSLEQNRLFVGTTLANRRIIEAVEQHPEINGMGTTLTGALLDGDQLAIVNVGDSRVYRVREGQMVQITQDHTLVGEWERKGKMTRAEARTHPQRHILTSALGIQEKIRIDITSSNILIRDLFLLCSDGLYDMLEDQAILDTISSATDGSLYKIGLSLVLKANLAGGSDNITIVLLSFQD